MINLFLLGGIRSKKWKFFILFVMFVLILAGSVLFRYYARIFSSNIDLNGKETEYLYIPTGSDKEAVCKIFDKTGWIKNMKSLDWVMEKKNYYSRIHPGKYQVWDGMSNNELINLLRSGIQTPTRLTFNNSRTLEGFSGKIARQIEADSVTILNYFKNQENVKTYGFEPRTVIGMFIPNTYQVYWNIGMEALAKRMYAEYSRFWNVDRLQKAEKIGLSPIEVSVLASIVDEETVKNDEKSRVAGVYMNRLKRRIKLDADPTLKFALGDFSIRRILNKHKKIDSPYNTYKYRGLPPGPIRQPSISGIEAVLNYEKHRYFYFCANPDFSGYHAFAKTLREHNRNAKKYQRALNQRGIMK